MDLSESMKVINGKGKKYDECGKIVKHFTFDEFWVPVIKMFIADLNCIIKNSPPVQKAMCVYRGVQDDYYLHGKEGHFYKNNAFVSTSLNPESTYT